MNILVKSRQGSRPISAIRRVFSPSPSPPRADPIPSASAFSDVIGTSIIIAKMLSTAGNVSHIPGISAVADVVIKILEFIQRADNNQQEFGALRDTVVGLIVTVRDVVAGQDENHLEEFRKYCGEFMETLTSILNDLNAIRRSHGRYKSYLRSTSMANELNGLRERVDSVQKSLMLSTTLRTRLSTLNIADSLSRARTELVTVNDTLTSLQNDHPVRYHQGVRVIPREDIRLVRLVRTAMAIPAPNRPRPETLYENQTSKEASIAYVDWIATIVGERQERLVRVFESDDAYAKWKYDQTVLRNAWNSAVSQVYGIALESRPALIFHDGYTSTVTQRLTFVTKPTSPKSFEYLTVWLLAVSQFNVPTVQQLLSSMGSFAKIDEDALMINARTGELIITDIYPSSSDENNNRTGLQFPPIKRLTHWVSDHENHFLGDGISYTETICLLDGLHSILSGTAVTSRLADDELITLKGLVRVISKSPYEIAKSVAKPPSMICYSSMNSGFQCCRLKQLFTYGEVLIVNPNGESAVGSWRSAGSVPLPQPKLKTGWTQKSCPTTADLVNINGEKWSRVEVDGDNPCDIYLQQHFEQDNLLQGRDTWLSQAHSVIFSDLSHWHTLWFVEYDHISLEVTGRRTSPVDISQHSNTSSEPMARSKPQKLYLFIRDLDINLHRDVQLTGLFWASDKAGKMRLSDAAVEERMQISGISLSDVKLRMHYRYVYWDWLFYDLLREVQISCGFDPTTSELVRTLDLPLFEHNISEGTFTFTSLDDDALPASVTSWGNVDDPKFDAVTCDALGSLSDGTNSHRKPYAVGTTNIHEDRSVARSTFKKNTVPSSSSDPTELDGTKVTLEASSTSLGREGEVLGSEETKTFIQNYMLGHTVAESAAASRAVAPQTDDMYRRVMFTVVCSLLILGIAWYLAK